MTYKFKKVNWIKRIVYYLKSIPKFLMVIWQFKFADAMFKLLHLNIADLWVIKETVYDDAYNIVNRFDKHKELTMVDVGAYIGDFSLFAASMYPAATVYALEPEQKNYKNLIANISSNNKLSKQIKARQLALGLKDGVGSTELSNAVARTVANGKKQALDINHKAIKIINLKNWVDAEQINFIHLLKLDCEGAEYDIFAGVEDEWLLKTVGAIEMEYHQFTADMSVAKLAERLKKIGYKVKIESGKFTDEIGMLSAKQ